MSTVRWWEYRLNDLSGRCFWSNDSLGFVGVWQEVAPAQRFLALPTAALVLTFHEIWLSSPAQSQAPAQLWSLTGTSQNHGEMWDTTV